jgi:hypothetical protein
MISPILEVVMDISQAKCPDCGQPMAIRRTWCPACEVAMEGEIEVSPLGRLSLEDQLFVTAFLRHHGSIKKMESLFDISSLVLEQLSRGEITVDEAIERLG